MHVTTMRPPSPVSRAFKASTVQLGWGHQVSRLRAEEALAHPTYQVFLFTWHGCAVVLGGKGTKL
jgi:hypothetical protein